MLVVFALLVAGAVFARFRWVPTETPAVLDRLVITLALPGLILHEVPKLRPSASMLVPVGVAWGSLIALVSLVLLLGRVRRYDRKTLGAMLLVVPLGNTSFLGIPAITSLLGPEHVGPAVVYDQLGSFVGLVTWGTFAAARWGDGKEVSVRTMLKRLVTFPPLIALVLAMALMLLPLPRAISANVDLFARTLGQMLVPMTMLSVGMRLRVPRTRRVLEPLIAGLTLRMAVAPALVLLAMRTIGTSNIPWQTSVLESAMPPMVTAGVVAMAAGLDEELSTALVGVGALLAMVVLPLWAALL